ncbi:KEOPS complex subunit Pcc1 [uncultured Methanobrevibacter sp.]|uniref:KEOPS complex subunit Pcc1 n=1 Tax=uncultured Methanobrevibacter sp. TaxID=253161 RepID=UPI0025E07901|nr:KEOPS complex subunit Pcc1 [uncultured Methanobrevibacter sp.]
MDFDSEEQAQIVYDSILLEFETSPDYRSSMDLKLENNQIIITIDAEDATSFRASINSAIKWIKLAVEINELTENL